MPRYPDHIKKLMTEYSLTDDEVWQVHGSTWVVKHKAIERIGVQLGIRWEPPQVIEGNTADKTVVVLVTGSISTKGDVLAKVRSEWSFGEASPANNKNAYPWAMAEKRGKDRVILKFLAAHGDVYSEEEADDFRQDAPRPRTSNEVKKNSPDLWPTLEKDVRNATTRDELTAVWQKHKDALRTLPVSWREQADELFQSRVADFAGYQDAAE
mgnify:CR=1 FL=1